MPATENTITGRSSARHMSIRSTVKRVRSSQVLFVWYLQKCPLAQMHGTTGTPVRTKLSRCA